MGLLIRMVWFVTVFPLLDSALIIYSKSSGRCVDYTDRTMHDLGFKWRNSDCQICQCLRTVVACRNSYFMPEGYPDDCVAVFERENCRYRLQKKNNPMVECQTWS
ncbi:beta-microseminoprotein-like [Stegostoma tigrinum]|uniref:beta-microseminoprotein-like n=1 Tax=Stegostoma tigrinum TaxID=3053191 RepID=UPI00202B0105|nr:beta-microseminoprotein-like [Stegostoma tigrinum]